MLKIKKTLYLFLLLMLTLAWNSFAIQVYPRIFSPTGDGANDRVIFHVDDNQGMLPLHGEIFDMVGDKVVDLIPGPVEDSLMWDGKRGGSPVPSGIYIYRVELGSKSMTGTVVVAQ
jgi:gliding motility-associated-like protein